MKQYLIVITAAIILNATSIDVYATNQKNTREKNTPVTISCMAVNRGVKISVMKTVNTKCEQGGTVQFIDNDGTVYYCGRNNADSKVYTIDKNGKEDRCLAIKSYTDKDGDKIIPVNIKIKRIGDYIYIMYNGVTEISKKSLICLKVSDDLKVIEKYDLSNIRKDMQYIDTNGKKVCYVKNRNTIYICDMNGKNKQKLYSSGTGRNAISIDSVAMNADTVAFAGQSGYGNNIFGYVGMIDLKTGESKTYKQKKVELPRSFDDKILWYGGITSDYTELANSTKTSSIYVKNGDKISSVTTESETEGRSVHGCIDSKGRLITLQTSFGADPVIGTIRVYENGKCIAKKELKIGAGTGSFYANGGIAAISYLDTTDDRSATTVLLSYE